MSTRAGQDSINNDKEDQITSTNPILTVDDNRLINALPHINPGLDPSAVIAISATGVQKTFTAANLVGIDDAYMKGLHNAFTLAVLMAGIATLVAVSQKWFRLNKPETSAKTETS